MDTSVIVPDPMAARLKCITYIVVKKCAIFQPLCGVFSRKNENIIMKEIKANATFNLNNGFLQLREYVNHTHIYQHYQWAVIGAKQHPA